MLAKAAFAHGRMAARGGVSQPLLQMVVALVTAAVHVRVAARTIMHVCRHMLMSKLMHCVPTAGSSCKFSLFVK